MKINSINGNFPQYKLGFKSIRTDKNEVAALQNGVKPILENQKINILNSLNNLAKEPEKSNIDFLLNVADNLTYGAINYKQGGNICWSDTLKNTISEAIDNNKTDNLSDIKAKYKSVFESEKELTHIQKEILEYKDKFIDAAQKKVNFENEDDIIRNDRIFKNANNFINSSEISETQKKECLDKFIYLLSDDYKINPQLEDKKLQVVDEMLNDMIIKIPDVSALTIKQVDQRQSGICASISICRKAMAYEDKSRYMDIILSELSAEPTMEVFDITDLDSGKKVAVEKPIIDYNSALAKGYRIIDTSAHIWMQNAHTNGDGSILSESYTAFDDESYNIYDDASWYEGLDENYSPAKNLLKALIKEQELLDNIEARRKYNDDIQKTLYNRKGKILDEQGKILSVLNSTLSSVFKDKDEAQITRMSKGIIDCYKKEFLGKNQRTRDNSAIIALPKEITKEEEKQIQKKLISLAADYTALDNQISKIKGNNTNRSKYRYYKNLYQAAAAHRLAVEADVNMPDGVMKYERFSNIPPKETRITEYLNTLKQSFSSENVRAKYSDEQGTIPSKEELESKLYKDILTIETKIPSTINHVMKNLFDCDFPTIISNTIKNTAKNIANGDEELILQYSEILGTKKDKTVILNNLKKYAEKLDNAPNSKDIQEAVRILGFEDTLHAAGTFVSSYYQQLREGIPQEEYTRLEQCFGEKNIVPMLEATKYQFNNIFDTYQDIIEKWNIPSSRAIIIEKMEKNHSVLSRKKLDKLKSKFDSIENKLIKNDKIENKEEQKKANEAACKFGQDELEIFDQIEKNLSYMKKYTKNTYKDINEYMHDALEEQYSHIGMLNGQFWVREEGSSGLSANEQVRIIEQMTGKPYHIEYDVNDAVKQIKEGKGSGILSTSVKDDDYAFHAQYIPAVTSEDIGTKSKKNIQDILWTDNSWGYAEWKDSWRSKDNGINYTDYGNGYGWKDGFILRDNSMIGLPVKDIHCAVGYAGKEKEKFGLFSDIVLPGVPTDTYQKLYKMFNNIFEMNQGEKYVEALEEAIDKGEKVDINYLVNIDDLAENYTSKIEARIANEINSKEDFDKLPENDEIKIIMNQLSLYFATSNPMLRDSVIDAKTMDDIEEIKEGIIDEHIDTFLTILAKSDTNFDNIYAITNNDFNQLYEKLNKKFGINLTTEQIEEIAKAIFADEESSKETDGSIDGLEKYLLSRVAVAAEMVTDNKRVKQLFINEASEIISKCIDEDIRIKTQDSPALKNSPVNKEFIAAIDKYLKPKSDEELLLMIQCLQKAKSEEVENFVSSLKPEDIGLEFKEPYDFLRKYQIDDSLVTRAFSEIVGSNFIADELGENDDEQTEASAADLFRTMHIKLSEMDVQKYVKKFKDEAFNKYKIRQAFPQPVVFTDDEIATSVNKMLEVYSEAVSTIKGNQFVIELIDKKNKFSEKYADSELYNALLQGQKIDVEENKDELNSLLNDLDTMHDLVSQDESLGTLILSYGAVIQQIKNSSEIIDGAKMTKYLAKIDSTFNDWQNSNANITTFEQNIKEELTSIREGIRTFVTGAIEPKYRNEATEKIKRIITLIRKEAPQEDVECAVAELQDFCIEKHITKNPTILLQETVKCLQEGKKDSDEYAILKQYLVESLKVAQQTKVQYKLVQNQHEGIGSKTKDMLPMFNVTLTDGTREPMNSPMGMLYLVEQLSNQGDNNVTLNLFLEQAGMTEDALKALIDNFELDNAKTMIDENAKLIIDCIDDMAHLNSITDDFFEKSRISYKSFKDAFEQVTNYVKRKTRRKADSPIIKNFINYMEQVEVKEDRVAVNSKMFNEMLTSVVDGAMEYLSDNINYKIEYLESIPELLEGRANLLSGINVPKTSEVYKQRGEFITEYKKTMKYIQNKINKVYQVITESQKEMQPLDEG